jgi:hypothetical protein
VRESADATVFKKTISTGNVVIFPKTWHINKQLNVTNTTYKASSAIGIPSNITHVYIVSTFDFSLSVVTLIIQVISGMTLFPWHVLQ